MSELLSHVANRVRALLDRHSAHIPRNWYDVRGFVSDCLEAHRGAIETLGGLYWHGTVSTPPKNDAREVSRIWSGVPGSVSCPVAPDVWSNVWTEKLAPRDYTHAPDDGEHLLRGPVPSFTVKKGERVSRAVLRVIRRYARDHENGDAIVGTWERFAERLGQRWQGVGETWDVSVSVSPETFLLLGHMGESSCYQFGGQFEIAKWCLALFPRSCVVTFYRHAPDDSPTPNAPRGRETVGRCWGHIGDAANPGVIVSNLYRLDWETARPILRGVVAGIFNVPPVDVAGFVPDEMTPGMWEEHVYLNGDEEGYAPHGDGDPVSHLLRECGCGNANDVDDVGRRCDRCGNAADPDCSQHCENCGDYLCEDCAIYFPESYGTLCAGCCDPQRCVDCHEMYDANVGGSECSDCADNLCDDCSRSCGNCGDTLCEGCAISCAPCGDTLCEGCAETCADCGDRHCEGCGTTCEGCTSRTCDDCTDDHTETCEQSSLELEVV